MSSAAHRLHRLVAFVHRPATIRLDRIVIIVITAPTGDIGRQVLAEALTGSEPIRVVARDPSKLSVEVLDRVEVIQGSHADAKVVARAFDGADSLFWLPPGGPAEESAYAAYVAFSKPAVAALTTGSIKRVVAVSALGRGWPKDAGHVTATHGGPRRRPGLPEIRW